MILERDHGGIALKPVWLRRGDAAAACAVGLAAVLCAVFLWYSPAPASQVEIEAPDGRWVYALSQSRTVEVHGNAGITLTVEIANGTARVRESTCPDLVCVHSGVLSHSGQAAACVPAGVSVRILGGDTVVDGVTG